MKKLVVSLILVQLFLVISYCFWEDKFLNFAYIPQTAYLNFDWQLDGNIYEVNIRTDQTYSVTWLDNSLYECFDVYWTWYTDTLWEVYFWYDDIKAYFCSDGKWRWYAKLWAWWWIQFEDNDISDWEDWKINIDIDNDLVDNSFIYHSADWSGNGTGYSFSDWVWLWNWNLVKTTYQPRKAIYDFIDTEKSKITFQTGKKANWKDVVIGDIEIFSRSWSPVWWFFARNMTIMSWNSIFEYDWTKLWVFFDKRIGNLDNVIFSDKWDIITWFNSVVWGKWEVGIRISYSDKSFIISWYLDIKPTIWYDLDVLDWDWDAMILIWWELVWDELGKINRYTDSLLQNITISTWKPFFQGTWEYKIRLGDLYMWSVLPFDIAFYPISKYIDNKLWFWYDIEWSYDLWVDWKLFKNIWYKASTDLVYFYPDKKITELDVVMTDCDNPVWNWKDICKFNLQIKNKRWYGIPKLWLSVWIDDANKESIIKHYSFDIDEITDSYENWLYVTGLWNVTDNEWYIPVWLISYKPVLNWKLKLTLSNISDNEEDIYNWASKNLISLDYDYTPIAFNNVVDLYFSWSAISEWVFLNQNNQLDIMFENSYTDPAVSEWSYELVWTITGCPNCSFLNWWTVSSNGFWTKTITVFITWSKSPDYLSYYDTYYKYNISWTNWVKEIKLRPNIALNWEKLNILWQFFEMKLMWIANKIETKDLSWIKVIGSVIPFAKYINNLKWDIERKIRGTKNNKLIFNKTFLTVYDQWMKLYSCEPWVSVYFWDDNNSVIIEWENELILKDCLVYIKNDIIKTKNSDKLRIISLSTDNTRLDLNKTDWWNIVTNLYIYPSVKNIFAELITDWSLIFLSSNFTDFNNIYSSKRWSNVNLKNQIYIKWKIFSRNTIWWWLLNWDKYTLPWWIKYDISKIAFQQTGVTIESVAQAYDIAFARWSFTVNWLYETWTISEFIYNNYKCTWHWLVDNSICTNPVVLEYED